ncbi:MAG TPA: ankyrin repeat domain-containing protein [Pyrinomonadaceae bacterium]|nr:ankyrin repeat domain-containing protein [Pyrinomonadaceae bacterium]
MQLSAFLMILCCWFAQVGGERLPAAANGYSHSTSQQTNEKLDRALIDAIDKGDQRAVVRLLAQGASVNARGINDTALETAIFHQNVEISRLLLARGAKIEKGDLADAARGIQGDKVRARVLVNLLLRYMDQRSPNHRANLSAGGAQALRDAATSGNREILSLLIKRRAPVNGKDENGEAVLFNVVKSDHVEAVQMLVKAGADVNATGDRGLSVLMNASRADYRSDVTARIQILKLLLQHGARISARDKDGKTAIHYSVVDIMSEAGGFHAHPEIVSLLIEKGADVNAMDEGGITALMETALIWKGTLDLPKLLIAKGAVVNLNSLDGTTVLMLAAEKGRTDLAKLLLESGALIDAKDKLNRTAMMRAVEAGEPEMVALLIKSGADRSLTPYKTDAELNSALHGAALLKAVTYGKEDDARRELDGGADVNARSRSGGSALMWAASGYKNELVELLVTRGADVNAVDEQGSTALMSSANSNNRDAVKLLLDHSADTNIVNKEGKTALLFAAKGGHTQIAEQLLAKGADFRVRTPEGRTPLLEACSEGSAQEELVQLLIAKGADPKVVDNEGNTALILAARAGAFQMLEPLMAAGVDVNAKNKAGQSALKLARETKNTYDAARELMIKTLIKGGAKE